MRNILLLVLILFLVSGCISRDCYYTSNSSDDPDHVHRWCKGDRLSSEFCTEDGDCYVHEIVEDDDIAKFGAFAQHEHRLHNESFDLKKKK